MRNHKGRKPTSDGIDPSILKSLARYTRTLTLFPGFAANAAGKSEVLRLLSVLDSAINKKPTIGLIFTSKEIEYHKELRTDIGLEFEEADRLATEFKGLSVAAQGLLQPDAPMIRAIVLKISQFAQEGRTRIAIDSPRRPKQALALLQTGLIVRPWELELTKEQCIWRTYLRVLDGQDRVDNTKARARYDMLTRENADSLLVLPDGPGSRISMSAMLNMETKLLNLAQFFGFDEDQLSKMRSLLKRPDHPVSKRIAKLNALEKQLAQAYPGMPEWPDLHQPTTFSRNTGLAAVAA